MKLAAVSNLAQRVLVGVVFGPLLVALFWTGGLALLATLWVVTAVGTWEYCKMQEKKGLQPWTWLGVAASLIWCVWNFHFNGSWVGVPLAGSLLLLLALGMCSRENGFRMADAGATLIGSLYVGFLASFALLVRNFSGFEGSQDGAFTVLVLVGIWATDIGAYVAGRLFGRRHPFPRISPGKTEAGFIGGVIGALAVMLDFRDQFHRVLTEADAELLGSLGMVVCHWCWCK